MSEDFGSTFHQERGGGIMQFALYTIVTTIVWSLSWWGGIFQFEFVSGALWIFSEECAKGAFESGSFLASKLKRCFEGAEHDSTNRLIRSGLKVWGAGEKDYDEDYE
jgi:hypothetical protein